MALTASPAFAATISVNPGDSIQAAIDSAAPGDTINVAAGSYNEYLSVNKEVSIIGAGSSQVTINYGGLAGSNNAGVHVSASNVTIQGVTIDGGAPPATVPRYGLKVGEVSGVTISDVIVQNAYRSGFDLLGTSSSSLDNIQALNNGGHGIALTDCNGIAVSNYTESGSGWQAVSVATWGRYTPLGTSGIVFSGTNSFGSVFQLEEGDYNNPGVPPAGDAIITASTNIADGADVTVQASDFGFALHGTDDEAATTGVSRTYLFTTLADAQTAMLACSSGCGHLTGADMYIESLSDSSQLYVSPGGTIQAAIDAASSDDTVNVAAGTYAENVIVNKALTLAGAGAGSTTVQPAVSLPNPCGNSSTCGSITASSNVIAVQANDVVIHDLTVDGDNPGLTSGIVVNGADLDARNGIITNHHAGVFTGTEVYNVTVQNVYLRGIYASTQGGTFNIHDNTVTNAAGDPAGSIAIMNFGGSGTFSGNHVSDSLDGIVSNWSKGTQYLNNTVTDSASGIHTDNAGNAAGSTADLIQGNTVSDCTTDGYGIFVFVTYLAPTVNENTVTNCSVGLSAWGGAFGTTVSTQFTDNTVNGPAGAPGSVGVYITTDTIGWGYTDVAADLSGNVITGNETGIYLTADEQSWNPGTYTAMTIDATFMDNSIAGNTIGLDKGTGGTVNADASGNWWGSNDAATVGGLVNGADYSPWLDTGTDTDAGAGFQGDFSTLWADDDSIQSGAAGHIEEAIDLVTASTIYLAPGTYAGADVDKSVSIIGQTGVLVNSGPLYGRNDCSGNPLAYGFQILGPGGSGTTISNIRFEDVSFPVYGRGADNVTLSGNTLVNPMQGISNRSGSGWQVTGNTIQDLRSSNGGGIGIIMLEGAGGSVDNNTISNNTISGTLHVPACESGGYEGSAIVVYADWRWYPYFTGATSVSGNQITDNTIDLVSDTPAVLGVSGIELTNAKDPGSLPEVPSVVTDNTISGNVVGGSLAYGVNVIGAAGSTIIGNTVSEADTGISVEASEAGEDGLSCSKDNTVSGNVFLNNTVQAVLGTTACNTGNSFDGNYWSDYVGPGPYVFSTGQDNSPSGPPQVVYLAPTGTVNVNNPVITAEVTGGTPTGMIVELGLSAQLDPLNLWDVTLWTFPCILTGTDASCPTSGLPEGTFTPTVTAIDANGLMGQDVGADFTIEDDAPPVTIDDAPAGWVNTDVTVTLTCTDAVTGCAETTYEVDGGPTQTGNTVVLTDEGVHTITYRSSDNDTPPHVEADNTATVRIDKTAPTTTDDADGDWHNSDVTVNLSCDDGTLSGCDTTYWSADNGGGSGTGNSVVVSNEGVTTITYYSTDVAGNSETPNTALVYIDKTAPVVAYSAPTGTVYTLVTSITGTVTDAALSSGINPATGAVMSLDNGVTFPYSCTVSGSDIDCPVSGLANDTYDVVIAVTDNAGNTGSASGSFTYAANGKPNLSLSVSRVYWASMADYTVRELSVDYRIRNNSVGITAEDVEVVGTIDTNSVLMVSTTPVAVGDIVAGSWGGFTLKYALPMGVSNFKSIIYATAYDPAGTMYEYPTRYPTP